MVDEHESHGGASPLLVFINTGSGGHVGVQLASYFKEALGKAQVISSQSNAILVLISGRDYTAALIDHQRIDCLCTCTTRCRMCSIENAGLVQQMQQTSQTSLQSLDFKLHMPRNCMHEKQPANLSVAS